MKVALAFVAAFFVAACAAPYKSLVINTEPQGAVVFQSERGGSAVSPATLYYDPQTFESLRDPDGCVRVAAVHARWTSGAATSTNGLVPLCGDFELWMLTLRRPDVPGADADLAAERLRMQELRLLALKQQVRDQQGQAALAEGFEVLGYGVGCAAAGGCGRGSPPVYYERTPPAAVPPPSHSDVPVWARKRDPLDSGTVCAVDSWGRTYCGVKQ